MTLGERRRWTERIEKLREPEQHHLAALFRIACTSQDVAKHMAVKGSVRTNLSQRAVSGRGPGAGQFPRRFIFGV